MCGCRRDQADASQKGKQRNYCNDRRRLSPPVARETRTLGFASESTPVVYLWMDVSCLLYVGRLPFDLAPSASSVEELVKMFCEWMLTRRLPRECRVRDVDRMKGGELIDSKAARFLPSPSPSPPCVKASGTKERERERQRIWFYSFFALPEPLG